MEQDLVRAQAAFLRRVREGFTIVADAAGDLAAAFDRAEVGSAAPPGEVLLPEARGPRQQEIVEVLQQDFSDEGLKTGEIAKTIGMDQPNAYMALQALQKQGTVEMVPGADPQRWRLSAKYRLSREIVRAARMVRPGEWTSYGDISEVVYNHRGAGLAVARVASTMSDFPNPHRIVQHTGQIHEDWRDGDFGPEECARRLRDEGVEVDAELYAHMRHHVDAESLRHRVETTLIIDAP